jgi:hypothetical protein
MHNLRSQILGLAAALLLAGAARADMVAVSRQDSERRPPRHVCSRMDFQQADSSGLYDSSVTVDLEFRPVRFLPQPGVDYVGQTSQAPYAMELTGRPDSSSLCLYALMGLGLCAAPHWIRRLSCGFAPEWYHDGGPFQIGHSHAATPESLCSLQVCFLAPPDDLAEYLTPQHRLRILLSIWRKSHFTPTVLAPRGPPDRP